MKNRVLTCGLDAALFVLGGKWKPLILFHLANGARRYGDLRRAVGNVEYSVTNFGRTLGKALIPLCEWGTQYITEVEAIAARRKPRQAYAE
jgi:DNA-binding HxlR family transcriptional regulator